MTRTPLTVHNAEIRTATVEIKTLTLTGKQVTLAVFRQLREETLVDYDGTLSGTPWGTVNYHPDKCAERPAHFHVVWQKGSELRRSSVHRGIAVSAAHEVDNAALWVEAALLNGWTPRPEDIPSGFDEVSLSLDSGRLRLRYSDLCYSPSRPILWPRQHADAGLHWDELRSHVTKSLDRLGTTFEDLDAAVEAEMVHENNRRRSYLAAVNELMALPQLFIAV